MNTLMSSPPAACCRRRAFSLMELMLAMSIMAVIVGALYGMFHHTQKALRANVTQVDVLEAGRAAMDFLVRDFEQVAASRVWVETNVLIGLSPLPLFRATEPRLKALYYVTNPPPDFDGYNPVVQNLMLAGETRTNVLGEAFLLNRIGDRFRGTSYRVVNATNGVGTLARYSGELAARSMGRGWLSSNVLTAPAAWYSPIADRVVHFRVRAFDAAGLPLTWETTNRFAVLTNYYPSLMLNTNLFIAEDRVPTETALLFRSNAVPTYLEIELGLLEPRAYDQYRAFDAGAAQAHRFLQNRAAQVHLFRQRIAVRSSTPLRQTELLQVAVP